MSVRIRLRRERDRLQQRAAGRDRVDGLLSWIGDPQIAIRCRQHRAAPGLRLSGVAGPITAGWPTTQDLAVRHEGGRPATKLCFDCHIS